MTPRGAIGPGASSTLRGQLWDLYCQKYFVLDNMDLAGLTMTLFDIGLGTGAYLPLGGIGGVTQQVTVTKSDTNLDTQGSIPYEGMTVSGLALQAINTQMGAGETGNNDFLPDWAPLANSMLQGSYVTLEIDDTKVARILMMDAPGASAPYQSAADGTNGSGAIINGFPLVNNYLDFGFDPIKLRKNTRIKLEITFGQMFKNYSGCYNLYYPDSSIQTGCELNTAIRAVLKSTITQYAQ